MTSDTHITQTILLAGSGRSGTTWLSNIIAANPNVRIYFEPFDYRRVPQAAVLPLFAYARPQQMPTWAPFVKQALAGDIANDWVNRQRKWGSIDRFATRRLVKAIRANLMLGWIDETFKPRIVFTIRHPCAVILSRMKLGWETHLDVMLAQPELVADYLEPYLPIIENAETDLQKQAVMWAIENLVPLQQMQQHNWVFCPYETFVQSPEQEADRVLAQLGLRQTWFTKRAIQQVSVVTRPDSSAHTGKNLLDNWKRVLSPEDIGTILDIVQAFNIWLYDADPLPHLERLPQVAA